MIDYFKKQFLLVPIITITAYLVWVASYIKIDYYDSFLILLNARCIATFDILGFSGSRPIILPIFLSPFFYFEKILKIPLLGFTGSHIFMITFFAGVLFFSYRIYRFYLSRETSLLATFFLALNRVLIHSAPHCKEDVFALCLMAGGFYFYLKGDQRKRWLDFIPAAFLFGLAIGARYNYPLIFFIVLFHQLISKKIWINWKPKLLLLFAAPILIFLTILSFHYSSLKISTFWGATYKYVTEPLMYMANLVKNTYPLPPIYNVIFLIKACSGPFFVLFLLGIFQAWRSKKSGALFLFTWIAVFFGYHTFLVGQKEARFLIAFFPPFYFFVVLGFEAVIQKMAKSRWIQSVFIGLILMLPIRSAWMELIQFRDPVYHVNFARNLSLAALRLAKEKAIFWVGPFYTVYPKKYIFHVEDVTYYVYHMHIGAPLLHINRYTPILENAQFLIPTKPGEPVFVGPGAGTLMNDGDVVIVNVEKEGYNTKNIPPKLHPLYVQRARKLRFNLASPSPAGTQIFLNRDLKNAFIEFGQESGKFFIRGAGIPNGRYEIYLEGKNLKQPVHYSLISPMNGLFISENPNFTDPGELARITLFYFDSPQEFYLPR